MNEAEIITCLMKWKWIFLYFPCALFSHSIQLCLVELNESLCSRLSINCGALKKTLKEKNFRSFSNKCQKISTKHSFLPPMTLANFLIKHFQGLSAIYANINKNLKKINKQFHRRKENLNLNIFLCDKKIVV